MATRIALEIAQTTQRKAEKLVEPALKNWVEGQSINLQRHLAALRPFKFDEFGQNAASPTEGHIQAVNSLLDGLRVRLQQLARRFENTVEQTVAYPEATRLPQMLRQKQLTHHWVQAIERIWDFYFELFGQRQSQVAGWLLACDRIALDCYQHTFLGLGIAKSIPAPPPFAYLRTGFSPATFRRGIPLQRLGQQLNPFPLVQLPYHRLVNPWTLGAILHEVSHNLQNELGLAEVIPANLRRRLLQAGYNPAVAAVWARWNREIYADLSGLLLGGPAVVASLLDVIGRSPSSVTHYVPQAVHPTPYLRTFLSIELLRRMGFITEAEQYRRTWEKLYPRSQTVNLPPLLLKDFPEVVALVVDTICYTPYKTLGDKSLVEVIRFAPKEQQMVEEAARRLAKGDDPGIVPERFLIGAARFAFDQRLTQPNVVAEKFYRELAGR